MAVWTSQPPLSANHRGGTLVRAMWIEFAIMTVVMAARCYTRIFVVSKVLWDDFWMMTAFLVNLVAFIFNTFAVNNGFGMHAYDLDDHLRMEAVKWADLGQVLGIMGSCFARLGFIMTLIALLGPFQRIHLWILRGFFAVQVAINTTIALYILLQCDPIAGLWNHTIGAKCLAPHIQEDIGFSQATNAFTDLSLSIIPATIIWNLSMRRSLKISLMITMGLGVFACVTAVIKTVCLTSIGDGPDDPTYNMWGLQFWFSTENCTLVVAATISVLRPLFSRNKRGVSTYKTNNKHTDNPFTDQQELTAAKLEDQSINSQSDRTET